MKKVILLVSLLFASTITFAEGFQVNLQSTKQTGMGHTGTAIKLGAEGMHFNPASLIYIPKMDFSAGITGVKAIAKYESAEGYKAKTDNKMGTPLFLYAGFSLIPEKLAVGLSVTTPYGSTNNWGRDWEGSSLVQDISLKSYFIQPTVAVKLAKGLSFGAGLMIATGDFSISRGLLPSGALYAAGAQYEDVVPLSVGVSGSSSVRIGYNIGLMYEFNDQFSVGLNYRSKVVMKVSSGEAKLSYIDAQAKEVIAATGLPIPPIDEASFSSELPLPSNLTLGFAFKPITNLLLALDVQYTGWSSYERLDLVFNEDILKKYNIVAEKKYENTFGVRLGGQYTLNKKFDLRAGIYYDQTPVQEMQYNPETPGADKVGISVGASYRPCKGLSIDIAFLYIDGLKTDGEYVTSSPLSESAATYFRGRYKSIAFAPSIGLSYRF
ncbi:MAG: outer membrane protein transport protein [Rikenellaceae bacterium]